MPNLVESFADVKKGRGSGVAQVFIICEDIDYPRELIYCGVAGSEAMLFRVDCEGKCR